MNEKTGQLDSHLIFEFVRREEQFIHILIVIGHIKFCCCCFFFVVFVLNLLNPLIKNNKIKIKFFLKFFEIGVQNDKKSK